MRNKTLKLFQNNFISHVTTVLSRPLCGGAWPVVEPSVKKG